MNVATEAKRSGFLVKVRREMGRL
jgi:hypothetical protein